MKNSRNQLFRRILTATLLAGGTFQLAAPVLAAGTTAGTSISNTATATYDDDNDATNGTFSSTSNTVTITVAEVASITVTSQAVTDTTPSDPVLTTNTVNYDFLITNVGNDSTRFFIPGTATVNGGTQGTIQVIAVNGTALATPITVPAGGSLTSALATFPNSGVIPANGTVTVRVPVTVTANAANSNISVLLGNTGANDNSAGTQNQVFPTAPAGNDLYTSDNPTASPGVEVTGAPANGEREASALGSVQLGAQPQAFAAVLATRTGYSNNNSASLSDDTLTYGLSLRVDAAAPTGSTGLIAANLVGTTINVTGAPTVPVVLVSDAIPVGTVLSSVATPPAGWTTVYSTDDPSVTNLPANAPAVQWTTTPPPLNTVKRIGFINPGPIAAGTTVTGFSFNVLTSGITTTSTVANIAQLYGQTQNGGTTVVYDESGDQAPSNFNDNGTPGSNTPTRGVANPAVDDVDINNNNTGTGVGGEDNVFTISTPGSVLNGPNGFPAAVHTTNNDDFTNRSTAFVPGTPTAPGSPLTDAQTPTVTFTNTISNPSNTTINGLLLSPTPPATATDLPPSTTVRLVVGGQSATYTYNGTAFTYTPVAGDTPITIAPLQPGASFSYNVEVNLPALTAGTALSTDTGSGFPVPIVAFVDQNANGRFDPTVDTATNNITIDRVYTGFLRLAKQARILNSDGTTIAGYNSPFFTTPTPADISEFRPGRILEYQITYTNISTNTTGTNNGVLNANRVLITEDGATLPNTWARDNDGIGGVDTSHVGGFARTVGGGVIEYFNATTSLGTTDPGSNATVTQYRVTVPSAVAPTGNGTFTFQRRLN